MKWLLLNQTGFYNNDTQKIAINPSYIEAVMKRGDEAKLCFVDGESIMVAESFEEVMNLLGRDCEWRLP